MFLKVEWDNLLIDKINFKRISMIKYTMNDIIQKEIHIMFIANDLIIPKILQTC